MFTNCLIAVVAILGAVHADVAILDDVQPSDIFDTAAARLQELDEVVTNERTTSLPLLDALAKELKTLGEYVVTGSAVQIQLKMNEVTDKISLIRQEALDMGIQEEKIDSCIDSYKTSLDDLPIYVMFQIGDCVNETVYQGHVFIDGAIVTINATDITVKRFALDIEQCKLLPDGTECVLPVIEEMSIAIVDLPAKIREETDKAYSFVEALKETLFGCPGQRLEVITTFGDEIVGFIRACAGMPAKIQGA